MELTVHLFTSLDGVVQSPGGPDEDPSGGFDLGGWLTPYPDEAFGEVVEGWFGRAAQLLLGRSTYDAMAGYWPQVSEAEGGRAGTALNGLTKHVVTSDEASLPWAPARAVAAADLARTVAELRAVDGDGELQVHGSWQLVQALHRLGLVDEYRLLQFPVVLGRGKRVFDDGAPPVALEVVDRRETTTGATYLALRPTGEPLATASFAVEDGREVVRG